MVAAKQTEDTHLGEEVKRYWGECIEQNYVFDRLEKEVSHGLLNNVLFKEIHQKSFYQQHVFNLYINR